MLPQVIRMETRGARRPQEILQQCPAGAGRVGMTGQGDP
jgi:hypothetical protein